jgi:hypothetical protein
VSERDPCLYPPLRRVAPREDWAYLHSLAQDELARIASRKQDCVDDRSLIYLERWMPVLADLGPHLSSEHLADHVSVGRLLDDLRDLSGFYKTTARDPLFRTRALFCSALVVVSRANPDHAPESLFRYIKFLATAARLERKPRVLSHIVAVARGAVG